MALDAVRKYIKETRDRWLNKSKLSPEAQAVLKRQFADNEIEIKGNVKRALQNSYQ